ncbi:MAG: hypothetical protein ACRCUY_10720 [Thermoguttaceae bacterium]
MNQTTTTSIRSLPELKSFVYQTLCHDHELLCDAFRTSESVIKRKQSESDGEIESCGIMFCLHGPRSVKFGAIWEKQSNRILFYGPDGKRYSQVVLDEQVE